MRTMTTSSKRDCFFRRTVTALAVFVGLFCQQVSAEEMAIYAGKLFNSSNGKLLENRTIHIVDGRIESVQKDLPSGRVKFSLICAISLCFLG